MNNQVYNHKEFKTLRRSLRKQDISAERILWSKLRNKQQEYKFRRQHGIGRYIIDFYCPKLKLAIEIDGATHSTDEEIKSDEERENFLKIFGIKVKRYFNTDVYKNLEAVLEDIYYNCKIKEVELKINPPHPDPLLSKERGGVKNNYG